MAAESGEQVGCAEGIAMRNRPIGSSVTLLFARSGVHTRAMRTALSSTDRAIAAATLSSRSEHEPPVRLCIASISPSSPASSDVLVEPSPLSLRSSHAALQKLMDLPEHDNNALSADPDTVVNAFASLIDSGRVETCATAIVLISGIMLANASAHALSSLDQTATSKRADVQLLCIPPDFCSEGESNATADDTNEDLESTLERIDEAHEAINITGVLPTAAHVQATMRSMLTHGLFSASSCRKDITINFSHFPDLQNALSASTFNVTATPCVMPLECFEQRLPLCSHSLPVEAAQPNTKQSLAFCRETGEPVDRRFCKDPLNTQAQATSIQLGHAATAHIPSFAQASDGREEQEQQTSMEATVSSVSPQSMQNNQHEGHTRGAVLYVNACVPRQLLSEALTIGNGHMLMNTSSEGQHGLEAVRKALSERDVVLCASSNHDIAKTDECLSSISLAYMLIPTTESGLILTRMCTSDEAVMPPTSSAGEEPDEALQDAVLSALDACTCTELPEYTSGLEHVLRRMKQSLHEPAEKMAQGQSDGMMCTPSSSRRRSAAETKDVDRIGDERRDGSERSPSSKRAEGGQSNRTSKQTQSNRTGSKERKSNGRSLDGKLQKPKTPAKRVSRPNVTMRASQDGNLEAEDLSD
jgi:hypothetical protein